MTLSSIAAIAGIASAGAGVVNSLSKSNKQQTDQSGLANASLGQAANNADFQRAVEALINQRSVAGTQDSFGSGTRYDPATNTWVSTLGALPKTADTAAMQAGVTRDTTDLQQSELANRQALQRAAAAGPAADTAQRELSQFRGMQPSQLVSLLQERASNANNNVYRPLIADTLRSFARTGTSAGPVLAQIGRSEAEEQRKGLIDAQIAGMTGADQINNSRLGALQTDATTKAGLANPAFQFSGIQPSGQGNTMAALLSDRAKTAATAPALGMYGVNQAQQNTQAATDQAIKSVPNPNVGLDALTTGTQDLSGLAKKGGPLEQLFGNKNSTNSGDSLSNIDIGFGLGNFTPNIQ